MPGGGASCRIGRDEVAVILPRTSADLAANVFLELRESLHRHRHEWNGAGISAGITELTPEDDPASVFGRAEQALRQARQAGAGTVVVATASDARRGI
jgi:GGDEF domain-containing protein